MISAALTTVLLTCSLWPAARGPLHGLIDQSHAAADAHVISGTVRDASGSVVAGASVVVRATSGAERGAVSGADGNFRVTVHSTEDMLLIVRAAGFSEARQTVHPADSVLTCRPSGAGHQAPHTLPAAIRSARKRHRHPRTRAAVRR